MGSKPVTQTLIFQLVSADDELSVAIDVGRDFWPVILVNHDDTDEAETLEVDQTFGDGIELAICEWTLHLDKRGV